MTREEKLQKAHQMFDNRNLLIELKWQKEYFKRGYVSNREELFNLWIFDECIKALEQEPKIKVLDRDEAIRKLGTVDVYTANAWITLLKDLEYLGLKICEVGE